MKLSALFTQYWASWARHPRERGKLVLGCLFFPTSTHRWLSYLESHAHLRQQAQASPKLVTRIYRPYALRSLNCRERVTHMIEHHEFLREAGWSDLTQSSCRAPLPIMSWTTDDGNTLTLQLQSLKDGHREGESHIQLLWNGQRLFSLSFLVRERAGAHQLLVTRFHGSRAQAAPEWIRQATKAMHGLRPADLLVQAAQHLAQRLGCAQVGLVSNKQRVALNPKRRMRIKVDLEKLWKERGAEITPDGLYSLAPEAFVRSDFTDIASHKRAQARRRAAALRQALDAMDAALDTRRFEALVPNAHVAVEAAVMNDQPICAATSLPLLAPPPAIA
jgi:uncharacterized protein VirK/YbjX